MNYSLLSKTRHQSHRMQINWSRRIRWFFSDYMFEGNLHKISLFIKPKPSTRCNIICSHLRKSSAHISVRLTQSLNWNNNEWKRRCCFFRPKTQLRLDDWFLLHIKFGLAIEIGEIIFYHFHPKKPPKPRINYCNWLEHTKRILQCTKKRRKNVMISWKRSEWKKMPWNKHISIRTEINTILSRSRSADVTTGTFRAISNDNSNKTKETKNARLLLEMN